MATSLRAIDTDQLGQAEFVSGMRKSILPENQPGAVSRQESLRRYILAQEEKKNREKREKADKTTGLILEQIKPMFEAAQKGKMKPDEYAARLKGIFYNPAAQIAMKNSSWDMDTIAAMYHPNKLRTPAQRVEEQQQQSAEQFVAENTGVGAQIKKAKEKEAARLRAEEEKRKVNDAPVYYFNSKSGQYEQTTNEDAQARLRSDNLGHMLTPEEANEAMFYKDPTTKKMQRVKRFQIPDIKRAFQDTRQATDIKFLTQADLNKETAKMDKWIQDQNEVVGLISMMRQHLTETASSADPREMEGDELLAAYETMFDPATRIGRQGMEIRARVMSRYTRTGNPEVDGERKRLQEEAQKFMFSLSLPYKSQDSEARKKEFDKRVKAGAELMVDLANDRTLPGGEMSPFWIPVTITILTQKRYIDEPEEAKTALQKIRDAFAGLFK